MEEEYDPKKVEPKWQDFWEKEKVYWFDWDSDKPVYSIDNPPRYANAALHLGHATSYTQIDFAARYKRMRNYNVFFPLCADVNGMPIEVSVEKKYGVSPKTTDRETLVKMCSEFASENIKEMIRQFKLLGHSMDPSIYYQTDAKSYRRITQISFIKMYKQGLIYRKEHPVLWCPRCTTALASADVEYDERNTYLNYIKFRSEDGDDVIIATTRPELICTCQLVAVNPRDRRYRHLVGKSVYTPIYNKKVRVVEDENVDPDFGTGVVMICTIGDKDDLEWVYKYDLPLEKGIDEEGRLTEIAGEFKGMKVECAREAIIKKLKEEGLLVKYDEIKQNVGTCWRCHTPVEFLQVEQWFLSSKKFGEDVLRTADDIRWHPEFMNVRLENWTRSLTWDWCISRQRYFATPIPVWECKKCKHIVVAEEEMCYVDPTISPPPVDKCPECGGELEGSKDVFDTWMDSSITPLFNAYWMRDYEKFKKLYPMSLRPQSHDIIRTWAYYTILRCFLLTGKKPWEEIIINGFIMAPDGTPMHTSRGNVVNPLPLIEQYGSDAFRYYATTCTLGMDHAFQIKELAHGRRLCNKIWNIQRFIKISLGENYEKKEVSQNDLRIPDRWIVSKYSRVIKDATSLLDDYQFDKAVKIMEKFVWHEFADHYIEMVKQRDDDAKKWVLYTIGLGITKLFAPFLPHICENAYQSIYRKYERDKSIHISMWPEPIFIDEDAEKYGEVIKNTIAIIRSWKIEKKLKHAEISKVEIYTPMVDVLEKGKNDIKSALKIKNMVIKKGMPEAEEKIVKIDPIHSKIGPKFKERTKDIVRYLRNMCDDEMKKADEYGRIEITLEDGTNIILDKDYFNVVKKTAFSAENCVKTSDIIAIIKV